MVHDDMEKKPHTLKIFEEKPSTDISAPFLWCQVYPSRFPLLSRLIES